MASFVDHFDRSDRDINGDNGWYAVTFTTENPGLNGFLFIVDEALVAAQDGEWPAFRLYDGADYRIDVQIRDVAHPDPWRIIIRGRHPGLDGEGGAYYVFADQDGTLYLTEDYFAAILGSAPYTPAGGDVLSLRMVGEQIDVLVNDEVVITTTSSFKASGEAIAVEVSNSDGTPTLTIDMVAITDLSPEPPPDPPGRSMMRLFRKATAICCT